jgi:hypothetical protein
MNDDGDVDVFDDGSSAVAGQAHLEKAREFVTRYDSQLRTLEYALTDALTAPWDPERTMTTGDGVWCDESDRPARAAQWTRLHWKPRPTSRRIFSS